MCSDLNIPKKSILTIIMILPIYTVQRCKLEALGLHSVFKDVLFGSGILSQIIFVKLFSGYSDLKSHESWLFTKLQLLLPVHIL